MDRHVMWQAWTGVGLEWCRITGFMSPILAAPAVAALLDDAAAALTRTLRAELASERSELRAWLVERSTTRGWHSSPTASCAARSTPGPRRVSELVERHHGRIAGFIENGVRALGPEGAVRMIEEHAGADLQFIRVNGTVVGGLAGGLIYAGHLVLLG